MKIDQHVVYPYSNHVYLSSSLLTARPQQTFQKRPLVFSFKTLKGLDQVYIAVKAHALSRNEKMAATVSEKFTAAVKVVQCMPKDGWLFLFIQKCVF